MPVSEYSISKLAGGFFVVALLGLAGCNTSGDNGVLDSAAKQGAHNDPANPTQHTTLLNTRTEMTDYCPRTTLREGTGTYQLFRNKRKKEDLRFQATILKIARDCVYEQGQLKMTIGVAGRMINGPSNATGTVKLPIRMAIKVGGDLVYSKLHKVDSTIAKGSTNSSFSVVDDQISFPAPTSKNVRVFVGFDEGPPKKKR